MQRAIALLLTTWVLLVCPALCQAGWLSHVCSCPDCRAADRGREWDPAPNRDHGCCNDGCADNGCPQGHSCQGDPCDTRVIRPRPAAPDHARMALQPVVIPCSYRPPLERMAPRFGTPIFLPLVDEPSAAAQHSLPLLV
ncbi:MAG: hypothetical protein HRF43_04160 [Phycisphaerae bacterium]|jgi:hypothetical protein